LEEMSKRTAGFIPNKSRQGRSVMHLGQEQAPCITKASIKRHYHIIIFIRHTIHFKNCDIVKNPRYLFAILNKNLIYNVTQYSCICIRTHTFSNHHTTTSQPWREINGSCGISQQVAHVCAGDQSRQGSES